jgi:alanine racemase
MARPTKAEVLLAALRHNLSFVRNKTEDAEIIPVVKADAYGHGAVGVSRELIKRGVRNLAVACLEEVVELQEAGIKAQIFMLGPLRRDEVGELVERNVVIMLSSPEDLDALESHAKSAVSGRADKNGMSAVIYVDTGMGRMGFMPEQVAMLKERLDGVDSLEVVGVFSHLPCADSTDEEDVEYTKRQIQDFRLVSEAVKKFRPDLKYASIANSGAVLLHEQALMSAVRPGIMIYGVWPDVSLADRTGIQPVMRWVTKIDQVRSLPEGSCVSYGRETVLKRPSKIALIPVGYADGLNRRIKPGFKLFVRGRPAEITGRITMDMTMIDVTDIPGAEPGDRVLIMGADTQYKEGSRGPVQVEVKAEDHAMAAGTIPYEILTSVGGRVEKVYLDEESDAEGDGNHPSDKELKT